MPCFRAIAGFVPLIRINLFHLQSSEGYAQFRLQRDNKTAEEVDFIVLFIMLA
jgi:hypothetical protein